MNPFDLSGRCAIVTGANTGIGQAIAAGLARAGADIIGVGRSPMEETASQVAATGRVFHSLLADLSRMEEVRAVIDRASALRSHPEILVNNAGIIRRADTIDFTEDDWDAVMDTNLKSAFFLCQSFAKIAIADHMSAKIINIASLLSFQGGIRVPSYTAAKSGLAGLTRLMANEWAARGINVNAIAPGYVETNNTTALRADTERNADILKRIPAGRWARADDMAGAAVFLASRASDYVHGTILPVDGGWLAR
ncbi:2-deoxy-D-gluconate 3-dehydrogenase [Rhizobium sp. Root73]|uniref:2-dehydro-3-deoxy-D-gluconate 5-dehydrogenase KduD n=1 Tax=unclassified Rhizobium TaxID=2613769 RepID=UPI00072828E5|nr:MULTISPECIES: 2-dehydro-3-deoxy-D-gluconate 5-dehydrogenase KduD [unclassified Rhizobium]KQY00517.1 2-deoxy-D-gluconate 3-dehydrogenase [Rhizobium sp. Root1334]KRC11702.1 2-deoxy-D-gluconate 3-dehydrogenase [Rhizobium sp. Root73]